jgi:hypothetical protein
MGATPSQSVKIKMFMPDERISLDGGYLEPFAGLEVAGEMVWLPLGRFYVTDVTTADDYKTVEITAYDKMNSLEETYVPNPAKVPETTYYLYTYTCSGSETQGQAYFFTANNATHQFEMPAVSEGAMLVFDSFDSKLHLDAFDGQEITLVSGSSGINLSEYCVEDAYYSAYVNDVIEDIAAQAAFGVGTDISSCSYRIDAYKSTYTYRQMIGYIAGLLGRNAAFSRDNTLIFRWYETAEDENGVDVVITDDIEYLDGLRKHPTSLCHSSSGTS